MTADVLITPTWLDVIVDAIEARLAEMHVGLPAKVVKFDPETGTCDAQPLMLRVIVDADGALVPERYPQIQSIPIVYPSGGGWVFSWPLQEGDTVFLAFCERSLDVWQSAAPGLELDPVSNRKFDISDAVAIPGMRPKTAPFPIDSANLRIGREGGDPAIVLKPDGTIEIGEGATESMVLGDALLSKLESHKHIVLWGSPGDPGETQEPAPGGFSGILSTNAKVK